MTTFEYTVIPAPDRGEKTRGARNTPTGRYALALSNELNRMAAEGWEYLRAEILPTEERSGLTGRSTVYHNLLVFRRGVAVEAAPLSNPSGYEPLSPAVTRPFTQPMRAATPVLGEPSDQGAGAAVAGALDVPKP